MKQSSRIAANNVRGTATSANWKTTYLACVTTLAPILTSFSRSVVRLQCRTGLGRTTCRRTLWDGGARRPSHADERRAWRRELLAEQIDAVLRPGLTEREIQAAAERLLNLAV